MDENLIILKYKPSLLDGPNLIKGRVIYYYEESGVCEVEDPAVTLHQDTRKKKEGEAQNTEK